MSDEKSLAASRAALTEYLRVKNMRKTPERFAILDKVCAMNVHFDIEALYGAIAADGFHVSRATLYSTMDLFVDCGIVRRHQFGTQPAQYERVTGESNHVHLICRDCGRIKEAKDQELVRFINSRRYSAFNSAYFCLYVYGTCSACARRHRREAMKEKKQTKQDLETNTNES